MSGKKAGLFDWIKKIFCGKESKEEVGESEIKKELLTNMDPSEYIEKRVKQYQSWYDKKSSRCKIRYQNMRAISVIGGASVPVLVNLNNVPYINYVTTVVSLIVVIFISLESVYHYREQWKNYRSAEQSLGHEIFRFLTKVWPYKGLDDNDAFSLFVERVERTIAAENSATLNIMTLAPESRDDQRNVAVGKI